MPLNIWFLGRLPEKLPTLMLPSAATVAAFSVACTTPTRYDNQCRRCSTLRTASCHQLDHRKSPC